MRKNETIALAGMLLAFADEDAGSMGTGEYIAHADGPDGSFDSELIEASSADEAREIAQSTLDEITGNDGEKVTRVRELSSEDAAALGNDDDDDGDGEDSDLD